MNGTNIENIFSTVLSMILRQRLNKNKETAIDEGKNQSITLNPSITKKHKTKK